jgi:hypothetical protein
MHLPLLHYHRGDTWRGQRPGVITFTKPYQHAIIASATEKVAVQEPRPAAEHRFFGHAAHLREIVVQKFL